MFVRRSFMLSFSRHSIHLGGEMYFSAFSMPELLEVMFSRFGPHIEIFSASTERCGIIAFFNLNRLLPKPVYVTYIGTL